MTSTAEPATATPKLSAAPATQAQRMPLSATDSRSVDLGGGSSVDAAQSTVSQGSSGPGDAEPASLILNTTMCPLSKCTLLRSEGGTMYFQVSAGVITCTVYVDLGRWSGNAAQDADLLIEAEKSPGSICVTFDSDWGDPDCKNPRAVHKAYRN